MDEKLDALTKAINSTENLFGEEFNKHPDALKAYEVVFGKDELEKTLASKNDLEYNAFYHASGCFERQVKIREIPTETVKFYIDQIIHSTRKNHMLLSLMETALERNEINGAISFIDELVEDKFEIKHHGHRKLLEYYAKTSNLDKFKKCLKHSKPAKSPKHDIVLAKSKFISNYAEENGTEKAIEILKDKVFGNKFCLATIEEQAHKLTISQINKLLEKYTLFMEHDEFSKPWLLVRHFANQKPITIDANEFEITISEILKVDKHVKRGDGRYRDYMLFDLGSSVEEMAQIETCKKHIIAPFYKRELNYHVKNLKGKTQSNKT
ncbi:MAG: hypothetical protein ACSHWW_14405 [Nonlabens sp.]|uniref:hypothetical protein n=1 Tax=Nonlabens sp. TaxID=1888209 RepID=UPI003EF71AAB